jgi:hypothetical protein
MVILQSPEFDLSSAWGKPPVAHLGEMEVPDHGTALEHGGRALPLQVLDQRDAVALGTPSKCFSGLPAIVDIGVWRHLVGE